jgi:beta-glucanase (GH16 family)
LIITAIPEDYENKSYTSGRVRLKTDGFKYGKYVIRARLPKGKNTSLNFLSNFLNLFKN